MKTGDRVRIKQWDDMVKEFGVDGDGLINCYGRFAPDMKHLCGRTATIEWVDKFGFCTLKFDDKSGDLMWAYSLSMLEPIKPIEGKDILLETDKILVYRKNGKTHIEVMD